MYLPLHGLVNSNKLEQLGHKNTLKRVLHRQVVFYRLQLRLIPNTDEVLRYRFIVHLPRSSLVGMAVNYTI
jgi:hypothetical protein